MQWQKATLTIEIEIVVKMSGSWTILLVENRSGISPRFWAILMGEGGALDILWGEG